jgi:cytochrome b561/polyisoprenoid-binding protein YceI
MALKNQPDAYGLVSKIIHWITALLILGLLSVGFFMAGMDFSEDKLKIYALHKSFGLLVLLLVFVRIAWHILSRKPKSLDTHAPWEKFLAHAAHAFLYFAMFALPLSGWVMSSAGDFNVGFFGIPMPDLVAKNEDLFKNARDAHEILAIILIVVVGLHMAGAFKHHFIDKDRTIKRMSRENLGFGGGAVLVVIAGLLMLPPVFYAAEEILHELQETEQEVGVTGQASIDAQTTTEAPVMQAESAVEGWAIIKDKSKIQFEATQYGQVFEGRFEIFDGSIIFNLADLATARADIMIDTASIKTGADDRDTQAIGTEWFDIAAHPQARFVSEKFESVDEKNFIAHGTLTIRGVSLPLDLPFSLEIENKDGQEQAKMKAELSLNRLDFGVGQGQWQSTDAIGNAVKIKIEVEAVK